VVKVKAIRPGKFNAGQITQALSQLTAGVSMAQICRELGVSRTTLQRWRKEREGTPMNVAAELRELRKENQRLREIVANFLLDKIPLTKKALNPV
jgi:putative transposase